VLGESDNLLAPGAPLGCEQIICHKSPPEAEVAMTNDPFIKYLVKWAHKLVNLNGMELMQTLRLLLIMLPFQII